MINQDAFKFIELRGGQGVTAEVMAKRFGMTELSAASWLSKWTRRGFLRLIRYENTPSVQIEELESLEKMSLLTSEQEDQLRNLRIWRARVSSADRGKAGRPPQGRYVLGNVDWSNYAHGKLEDRMAIRDGVKKW